MKLQVHEKDLIKLEKSKNMWRDNKKCEEEILSRVATLKDATLEHLEKSKATLLQAFVRVHRNVDSTETMARKGKAKEVRDKVRDKTGKPLLLQTVFELRDSPVVWEEPSAEQQVVPESSIVIPSPMVIPASGARVVPDFTVTDAWHKLAIEYIASIEILDTASAPSVNDVNLRTKKLSLLLLSRLERNLGQRLGISEDKKNHWVWRFFCRNIPRIAALMIMSRHVREDMDSFGDNDCYLRPFTCFQPATNSEAKLEGNYLYHDSERSIWVRAGSVTCRGFVVRHREHEKGALRQGSTNIKSEFYARYPHRESENAINPRRCGFFDTLEQYVGLGFNPSMKAEICNTGKDEVLSLLSWSSRDLKEIGRVNFRGHRTLQDKQYKMVGYAFEKAYDLSISPVHNVSRNPGFETPLGVFGG